MNYYINRDCYVYLDRFDNQFIYSNTGEPAELVLPLEITILEEDCVLYENDTESMIDYSPTTLGYYWVNGNQCIRTKEGLVFEPVECEAQAVQFILKDGELHGEKINSSLSTNPTGYSSYYFSSIKGAKAIVNKNELDEYTLEINGKKHPIWLGELEFCYTINEQTGFNKVGGEINYHGEKLSTVFIDTFTVLDFNYAKDAHSVFCGNQIIADADLNTFEVITMTLAKDKNNLYSFSEIIELADPTTFEIIDGKNSNAFELYAKDKNTVYYLSKAILEADLETFYIINAEYSADKNWVYRSGMRIPSLDANSFEYVSVFYVKDKNGIYSTDMYTSFITKNSDDFIDHGYEYFSCNGVVYWEDCTQELSTAIASFESIDYNWAKNDTHIFYRNKLVYEGDCSNVNMIDELIITANESVITNNGLIKGAVASKWELLTNGFYRSGSQLFYREEFIEMGDSDTFEKIDEWRFKDKSNVYIIDSHFYTLSTISCDDTDEIVIVDDNFLKIKSKVYFYDEEIVGAQPDTFVALEYGFSRDKKAVFNNENKLSKLDPNNITIINPFIIHDLNNLYYNQTLLNINVSQFEHLSEYILKDENNVYFQDTLIEGACALTYELCGTFFQKDKLYVYHNSKRLNLTASQTVFKSEVFALDFERVYFIDEEIIGGDITSFEIIKDSLSKDKNHVYYREKIIEKADPSSFKIMGYSQFMDKNHIYHMENGHVHITE
ncbi:DKNYY domain-containing protein [Pseudoalteromonas sp. TB64]|uniref:DKNYY domain-containing protein n=1 Tax=Pseudoalteromonas sp. TB64 TaxID=1938600 RepID=UPI00040A3B99|nr:DKNYY domain-containing protein [Pseudoalteromonas sp. TB64]